MTQLLRRMWQDDEGQDLIEYALLVVLIAVVVIAGLNLVGPAVRTVFTNIAANL